MRPTPHENDPSTTLIHIAQTAGRLGWSEDEIRAETRKWNYRSEEIEAQSDDDFDRARMKRSHWESAIIAEVRSVRGDHSQELRH